MDELIAALCFQLPAPAEAESVDGWRVLIPAPDAEGWIHGDDGRAWRNSDPHGLVSAFNSARPIDVNHAEDLKAKVGDEAPAYGWIEEIRVADGGAIEGRLAFNRRGTTAVRDREYRYMSPAFRFHPQTKEIKRLDSASLVNTANFALALNRRNSPDANEQPEANAMDLVAELRKALNLKQDASEADVLAAVKTQGSELETARNRPSDTPSLDRYVPRGDYDQLAQAKNRAEQKLADREKADHDHKVDAAITAAKAAGKITPATEDYHRANCRTAEGLAEFEKYAKAAPAVGDPSDLDSKTPAATGGALSDEEKAACRAMGVDEATYKERRDADAKAFG